MMDVPIRAALIIGLLGMVLEFAAIFITAYSVRRALHSGVLILTAFAFTTLLSLSPSVPTALIAFVAFYRLLNSMRVLAGRMHERHSILVVRRSSRYLLTYQAVTVVLLIISLLFTISIHTWLYLILTLAVIVALILALSTRRTLAKSKIKPHEDFIPDEDLPTLSVCIPARNETEDLSHCLVSVIASDYPKLEIIVLDDCSHDKTSEIIKGFAQDGVRFIAGNPPARNWVAKNQAYQALADAASGELLLFCGVDTRFRPETLRSMVATMQKRKKRMLSILPLMKLRNRQAALVQPMRYWWELALPRRLFNRPPVLSTCWIIQATSLKKLGGFSAVSNSIVPESYLAHELTKIDRYSFMRSSGKLVVITGKKLEEQVQTAIRTRYPQLRKRPEAVAVLAFMEISCLVAPAAIFIAGFFTPLGGIWLLSGVCIVLLAYIQLRILKACGQEDLSFGVAVLPIVICLELGLIHVSMWRYEFGMVEWKERNICIPVMHYIARLPKA